MDQYKKDLLKDLKNKPGYAERYLNAAAKDSDEALLVALRDVAMARKGMTALADAAAVNRVNLYHMLSEHGNPGIRNLRAIFRALDLGFCIVDERSNQNAKVGRAEFGAVTKRLPNAKRPTSKQKISGRVSSRVTKRSGQQ